MKIVRVVNEGSKPFVGKYDGEKFTIAPKSESLIPYGAMILWLGDPEARNIDERRRFRVAELNRLHIKYGAYEDEDLWEANRPRLKAHTLDGDLIPTVVEDPEGILANVDLTSTDEDVMVRRELEQLRAQQDRIEQMLADGTLQVVAPGTAAPGPQLPPPDDEVKVELTPEPEVEPETLPAPSAASSQSNTPPVDEPARVRVGSRSRSNK